MLQSRIQTLENSNSGHYSHFHHLLSRRPKTTALIEYAKRLENSVRKGTLGNG